jgi:hypothetical protein
VGSGSPGKKNSHARRAAHLDAKHKISKHQKPCFSMSKKATEEGSSASPAICVENEHQLLPGRCLIAAYGGNVVVYDYEGLRLGQHAAHDGQVPGKIKDDHRLAHH